jgi:hypothetical protein
MDDLEQELRDIVKESIPPVVFPEVQRVFVENQPDIPAPIVNVPEPQVTVNVPEAKVTVNVPDITVDNSEVARVVSELKDALKPQSNTDLLDALTDHGNRLVEAYKEVKVIGGNSTGSQAILNQAGTIINPATEEGIQSVVTAIESITIPAPVGGATAAAQTDGTQKTQIVDAGGEAVTVTGGKLDVNAAIDTTGLATSAKQDTLIGHVDGIEGILTTIDADTGTLAGAVSAGKVQTEVTNTVTVGSHNVTNAGTFAVQVTSAPTTTVTATDLDIRNLTATDTVTVTGGAGQTADVKVTLDGETVPVTGTFWQATQPVSGTVTASAQPGVDIGDVTINNASGASAVNIQDGGNSITVDNNGTFAVQATLAAETTKVIGTVNVAAAQTIATTNAGTFAVQQSTYATSSVTSVAASASSVQLLASTAGRRGAYFYNDSTVNCYLKLGTTASTSSFTVKIAGGGFYELPYPCYTGRIDAIWDSATGNIRITELS